MLCCSGSHSSPGTQFLREQRALHFGVLPQTKDVYPGVEGPGYVFSDETVSELRALVLHADAAFADRVLVLTDPERPRSTQLTEWLERGIEWQEYVSAADIFDTGNLSWKPPLSVIDQVATWLSGMCETEPTRSRRLAPSGLRL